MAPAAPEAGEAASYRRILKATSITGLSSVMVILISLAKTKVLAVFTGPAGVGLLGVYGSFVTLVATVGGMGLATQGARDIAAALPADGTIDGNGISSEHREAFRTAYGRLWWGSWVSFLLVLLGVVVAIFGLRLTPLGANAPPGVLAFLLLGAGLTVLGAARSVVVQGMRQIAQLARLTVLGNLIGAAVGIATLQVLPLRWALAAFVVAAPAGTFLVGSAMAARLQRRHGLPVLSLPARAERRELPSYVRAGVPIMLSGLAASATQYALRLLLERGLGTEAVGQFQASWAVGMQYLSLILVAMAGDYYPRLSAAPDYASAARIVNQQTEVAVTLAAPVVLALVALAPLAMHLLYTPAFAPAADVLRWQIWGDVGKLVAWPLSFLLLARRMSVAFLALELAFGAVLLGAVAVLMPRFGVQAAGIAFVPAYAAYAGLTYAVARRRCAFRWSPAVARAGLLLLGATGAALVAARAVPWGWTVGLGLAGVAGARAWTRGRAMWRQP